MVHVVPGVEDLRLSATMILVQSREGKKKRKQVDVELNLDLMKDIKLYHVDDKYRFLVLTPNRLPTGRSIVYLTCSTGAPWGYCYVYGIEFNELAENSLLGELILIGLKAFLIKLQLRTARPFNLSGGDLGRGDNL